VDRCVSEVLRRAGAVDVLVNNAGQVLTGSIEETSTEEAKAHFETNFFGAVRMTRAVLPSMRQRGRGWIVNVGSIAGAIPVPFEGFYAAGKAALLAYSRALRLEVAKFNIHVSVVEPGFFKTNIDNARKTAANLLDAYAGARERAVGRLQQHIEEGRIPESSPKRSRASSRARRPGSGIRSGRRGGISSWRKSRPREVSKQA
jgi:short-subunit dehydrogenase